MVSSEAVIGATISTRAIAGAGLKKWTPQTLSGRLVAMAISTTGRVEVLVARMAPSLTMPSSSAKRASLTARSSTTDSITRSQSASADSSVAVVTRPRISAASSAVRFSRATCLSRDLARPAFMPSALSRLRLRSTTS